jgi:1,4-dihydroxy-2-naphthoyl-CoA hydrolase
MAIWTSDPMTVSLERWENTMIGHLGIEAVKAADDCLTARMPVDERTRAPAGTLHGGAAVALAETVATWAASCCVDPTKHECIGLEVNANHLRAVADGHVYATARPLHLGDATQVWEVRIASEREVLVCVARVTLAVRDAPHWH